MDSIYCHKPSIVLWPVGKHDHWIDRKFFLCHLHEVTGAKTFYYIIPHLGLIFSFSIYGVQCPLRLWEYFLAVWLAVPRRANGSILSSKTIFGIKTSFFSSRTRPMKQLWSQCTPHAGIGKGMKITNSCNCLIETISNRGVCDGYRQVSNIRCT